MRKITYLNAGFYHISASYAKSLTGGILPRYGSEMSGMCGNTSVWVARTIVKGKQVWSMRAKTFYGDLPHELQAQKIEVKKLVY